MTYAEKLRDPRWQRRRLEIMQRADFRCERCTDATSTLNVHHQTYRSGASPWDYADEDLECLCEHCHRAEHSIEITPDRLLKQIYMPAEAMNEKQIRRELFWAAAVRIDEARRLRNREILRRLSILKAMNRNSL
jgi:5-methylcytosine-specific restriction endonuclease McrA